MKTVIVYAALLAAALSGGCSDSTAPMIQDPYIPNDSPEAVKDNFEKAWYKMDIEGYRALLYDGEESLSGKETCAAFKFYEDECTHTEALFNGEPGQNATPGIESISLALVPWTDWTEIEGEVQGDPVPAGCLHCTYLTNATIMLKDTIPGSDIIALLLDDMIQFYVIPVDVDGDTEYRLWKWMDVSNGKSTQDCSWGAVKALF